MGTASEAGSVHRSVDAFAIIWGLPETLLGSKGAEVASQRCVVTELRLQARSPRACPAQNPMMSPSV